MRIFITHKLTDTSLFKKNVLHYADQFGRCCILDNNNWPEGNFEIMAAIDSVDEIIPKKDSFDTLKKFYESKNDWLFGFLSYDLKNEIENLSSENIDRLGFPLMHFFQPKFILIVRNNSVEIGYLPEVSSEKETENIISEIINLEKHKDHISIPIKTNCRVSKEEYIETVSRIKQHIQRGDIYEMNYCIEFFSEHVNVNPKEVFLKLNDSSLTPYSAFYRHEDKYLMCASPELYLKKTGKKINSQPIKGTAKRGETFEEDIHSKESLRRSVKDKSENVMIVDLVRNDLSKTCNNVSVEELFGIYSFKQWHQMISSISGEIKNGISFIDVIKNSFPMGSMTGAPKLSAMELIEKYEKTKRGLYSGAIGFLDPDGNFVFNVVIRSILYSVTSGYLSFHVGSAITANSIPEEEYDECLLKAKGMFKALNTNLPELEKEELLQNA